MAEPGKREEFQGIGGPLPRTLLALTFVTGMIDAITFLALGQVFAAMMTGNVLFLGFGIADAAGSSFVTPLIAIVAFVCGGLLGGLLAARSPTVPSRGLMACLGLEVVLLAAATAIAAGATVELDNAVSRILIATLALAMGTRNTAVRRMGVNELPTNIVQVAAASFEAGTSYVGASPSHLVPRAAGVLALLAGAVAGALLLEVSLTTALATATALSLLASVAYALAVRTQPA